MKKIVALFLVLSGACVTPGVKELEPSSPETPASIPATEEPIPEALGPRTDSMNPIPGMATRMLKGSEEEQEILYQIRMLLGRDDNTLVLSRIRDAAANGVNFNNLDKVGYSVVAGAVQTNRPRVLRLLIEKGARLDLAFPGGPLRETADLAKPFDLTEENLLRYFYSQVKGERNELGLETEWMEEARRRMSNERLLAETRSYFQDIIDRHQQILEILDQHNAPRQGETAYITKPPSKFLTVYRHRVSTYSGTYDPSVCLVTEGDRKILYDSHSVASNRVTLHRSRNPSDPAQFIIQDHEGIEALKETMWKPWWYDEYAPGATMEFQGRQWKMDHVDYYSNGNLKSAYFHDERPAWLEINGQRFDPRTRTRIEFYESGQVKTLTLLGARPTNINGYAFTGGSNHMLYFLPNGNVSKAFIWWPSRTAHQMNVLCFPQPGPG